LAKAGSLRSPLLAMKTASTESIVFQHIRVFGYGVGIVG